MMYSGEKYVDTYRYKEIERGALVPLLTGYQCPPLAVYAIYPQTRHLSQRVRAFVDFLIKRFEGSPYWDQCLEKRSAETPDQQN